MTWRFRAPPGWPLPQDFVPPPDWQPDPAWPPAPYKWPFWVEVADPPPVVARAHVTSTRIVPRRYRSAAFAVDLAIVLIMFAVLAVLGRLTDAALRLHLIDLVTTLVALTLCAVVILGLTAWLTGGQTLGKAVFGLIEVRAAGRPGPVWAIARHSLGYAVVDVLGLGMLVTLVSPRRRCPHDLAFASEVRFRSDESLTAMPWRKRLETRLAAFTDDLESGVKAVRERHRRTKFLWDWLTSAITKVAGLVFLIAKYTRSGNAISTPPVATTAAGGHPATALSAKQATALWTTTATATTAAGLAIASIVSGPSVSQINVAFEFGTVGQPETAEIYRMHADGSHQQKLTQNTVADEDPRLYRDQLIAFSSDRDGNFEIYTMKADGSRQRRLTDNDADDNEPGWSPDGRQIVFCTNRDGNYEIYTMKADGSRQRRIVTNPADDTEPDWSPDGKRIVFVSGRDGNYEIYTVGADGTRARRLTDNDAADTDPAWSPDGRRIAFTSDRDGNREIYVMNADGSGLRRLTNDPASDHAPFWGLGGRKILFFSDRGLADPDAEEVWAMNAKGGSATRLTSENVR